MEIFLPAQEAARVRIGADSRIVLDARPEYAAAARVSYVSPEAQFTPKQVETRSERDKLMFRSQAQGPFRDRHALYRADQDRGQGDGLRAARRHGGMARFPGTSFSHSQALAHPGAAMPSPRKPVATVTELIHRYGKARALDALTAEIPSGCMVGLIGPDGVGKSTLMGIIAGAKKIQSGTVRVLDGDMASIRHRTAVCPRIAYMPQGLGKNLYFELSVYENIDFFGAAVRALRPGTTLPDRLAPEGDRPRPLPGPAGREAVGRHEAEGRALLLADPRPGPAHSRRAHDRRRPALASAVLDARSTTSAPGGPG